MARLYRLVPVPESLRPVNTLELIYGLYPDHLRQLAQTVNTYHQAHPDYQVAGVIRSQEFKTPILAPAWVVTGYSEDPQELVDTDLFFSVRPSDPIVAFQSTERICVAKDDPLHGDLQQLVLDHLKMERITDNALTLFNELTYHCKTPGQWNTVFPQYVVLLDGAAQRVAKNQKRRSPWPKGLDEAKVRPKLESLVNVFAKAALLKPWDSYYRRYGVVQIDRVRMR